MKTINSEAGFFKVYWDLLQQGQLSATTLVDENGNVKRNSKGEPKYEYKVSTQSLLLLSYLIDTWEMQKDFITDDEGVVYKRYSWSYIRERLYDYSDTILRKCIHELQENNYIVLKKLNDNPKAYSFISLNFENRLRKNETVLENRVKNADRNNTNINIDYKTKRLEEVEEVSPTDIPSSDISFLSKCIDRILKMDGKDIYLNDIITYSPPLLKREFSVEDLVLVFNWYKNKLGDKYAVSPKSCFKEENFNSYLVDAKIYKENHPEEFTDLSDLYFEREKEKKREWQLSHPEEFAKQQQKEERKKARAALFDAMAKEIDQLYKLKGWTANQTEQAEMCIRVLKSSHYQDGSWKDILNEATSTLDLIAKLEK